MFLEKMFRKTWPQISKLFQLINFKVLPVMKQPNQVFYLQNRWPQFLQWLAHLLPACEGRRSGRDKHSINSDPNPERQIHKYKNLTNALSWQNHFSKNRFYYETFSFVSLTLSSHKKWAKFWQLQSGFELHTDGGRQSAALLPPFSMRSRSSPHDPSSSL